MKRLSQLQSDFSRAVLEGEGGAIINDIIENGIPPEERLRIYRNNTLITLTQALAQNFPVLCRLVGKSFFDQMAKEFIRTYPPKSQVLLSYGAQMPDFLAQYTPLANMPYMSDVARLEINWNLCFNGPDPEGFDIQSLNEVGAERFPDLQFKLLPNLCLMESLYPVSDIWLTNQEGAVLKQIDLDGGPCHLVLFRRAQEVDIMQLDPAGYELLSHINNGLTLGEGVEEVLSHHPDFDLQTALQSFLQNGLIDGFEYGS